MDASETASSLFDVTRGVCTGRERLARWAAFLCAAGTVLITGGIITVLLANAAEFFADWPVWDFLTGTKWSPAIEPVEYGVLPLVCGTLIITLGSANLSYEVSGHA